MILTPDQLFAIKSGLSSLNGLIDTKYRWPNKTLAYILNAELTKEQQDYIGVALKTMESISCVKFVQRTNENDYVEVTVSHMIDINCIFKLFIDILHVVEYKRWMLFRSWSNNWKTSIEFGIE